MTKRLALAAFVVAAALVLAAPAMAFDGYRADYTPTYGVGSCQGCHGTWGGFTEWESTAHAMVNADTVVVDPVTGELLEGLANAEPIADGPGCAGCHSGNYAPAKHVPFDDPIPDDDIDPAYPWENTDGDDAFTEPFVGCSACHVGFGSTHEAFGGAPKANLANADICGQCHSRYSASVEQYENYDGTFSTRQYTLGNFSPLGTLANGWMPDPIGDYLNIATPAAPQSMVYYNDAEGKLLPWSARGHEEGAQQYNEWAVVYTDDEGEEHVEAHANALDGFIETMGGRFPFMTSCLECHSADYRLAEEGSEPTINEAKYGVTCQVCHDPHAQSEQTSLWNEERNPQLTAPREELCVECHNAEIPKGETATPGSEVHHPMKEIMDGTGAIGVPEGSPSVHKGKCVECHMVPTSYDRNGVPMTGANHVFKVVEPAVAAESLSTANIGGIQRPLPASSCSLCHGRSSDPYATYLTGTFENRQDQMKTWDEEVGVELTAAAGRLGYAATATESAIEVANAAINDKDQADWSAGERAFQSAFTNRSYIESEGSWGIHNWSYASTVIQKAMEQAKSVKAVITDVTITSPLVTAPNGTAVLTYGASTTISGKVVLPTGADTATLLGSQVRIWFKPAGGNAYQPVQQVFVSGPASDEYLFTVMPARSGTYVAQFVGNDDWDAKVSTQYIGLDVRYRVTITKPNPNVKLNTSVKFKGTVAPVDFPAGTRIQIQRQKAGGAWKNLATTQVSVSGVWSLLQKMTSTGTYRYRAVFRADTDHLKGTSYSTRVVVTR